MIHIDYKSGKTIHEQIEAELRKLIVNGILQADEQLPSVRDLSIRLTVNPNTVQRAYKELEAKGFIYSIKGKGNFVASAERVQDEGQTAELFSRVTADVKELLYLGANKADIIKIVENIYEEGEINQ